MKFRAHSAHNLSSRRLLFCILFISLGLAFQPTFVLAADDDDADKFQVHGFLTQAFATANYSELGPTRNDINLGIPDGDITADYRFLALQFRYQISAEDVVVVQLSSRSLGDSPINLVEDDVELDWAFYERNLGDNTAVKLGRIQIPFGIFNEIRDVGTILPFYRPPYSFYREGTVTSETVDGILFHHTFAAESDWSLSLDTYYGEYELVEEDPFVPTNSPAIANAKDVLGVQLWLNTPIYGLRFGAGYQQRDVVGGQEGFLRPVGRSTQFEDYFYSVEYLGGGWQIRAEYRNNPANQIGSEALGFLAEPRNIVSYAQVGYFFTEKFGVFLQYELSDVELDSDLFTRTAEATDLESQGVSFNYLFRPNLVLKAEYHETEQEIQGFNPVFLPTGFFLDPIAIDSGDGDYAILSFAVSF